MRPSSENKPILISPWNVLDTLTYLIFVVSEFVSQYVTLDYLVCCLFVQCRSWASGSIIGPASGQLGAALR